MPLIEFVKDVLHRAAEKFSSYRIGQFVLRKLDRGLWVLEKSSQWALPPSAETQEKQNEELVRPLPWIFFLMILLILRVFREIVSQANLLRGQPPMRPGEIVSFIQSRRRYLRALKYQGTRTLRAKSANDAQTLAWKAYQLVTSYLNLPQHSEYCNGSERDKTTDDITVLKKSNGEGSTSPQPDDTKTMERLIEKMVDMYASSDDSDFTLSNMKNKQLNQSEMDSKLDDTTISETSLVMSSTPRKRNLDDSNDDTTILNLSDISSNFTESSLALERTLEKSIRKPNKMVNGKSHRKKNGGGLFEGLNKTGEKSIPVLRISEVSAADDPKQEGSYSHKSSTKSPESTSTAPESSKSQPRNRKSKIKTPFWRRKNLNQTK